jgi:hypothetical protein
MTKLPVNPNDDEVLAVIDAWIADLSREDYQAAFLRTEHDPYYKWTPQLLKEVICGYGLPEELPDGRTFKVIYPRDANKRPPYRLVERNVAPLSIANVRASLPLNGEWSDLTAGFRVEKRGDGSVIILEEVHVL